jgi:hypothetical protein
MDERNAVFIILLHNAVVDQRRIATAASSTQ